MKMLKRLMFFATLFLLYLVARETLIFFSHAFSVSPLLGYAALAATGGVLIWFLILPILRILFMKKYPGPTDNPEKEEELIRLRLHNFSRSGFLREKGFLPDDNMDVKEQYGVAVEMLKDECYLVRSGYVRRLFYGSTISQNGFLDAILILTASVNLVRDIFVLHAGRASARDMMAIGRMVYYSTVIGGSESVEFLTEELFSKLASEGVKGIPFLGRLTGSLADGFVNAALLTRISLMTESYCRVTRIRKKSDLYPRFKTVYSTTKHIVSGLLGDAKALAGDKLCRGFLDTLARFFGKGTAKEDV